ncbi:MAG TPA: ester cyclase [Nitrospiraceae bacterium]|nr:ester cyclase [Nitrospiraceae bacterium]
MSQIAGRMCHSPSEHDGECSPGAQIRMQWRNSESTLAALRTLPSGTHRGVARTGANGGLLLGAKGTGKRFEVLQTHWWKFKDGKIVFHQGVRDDLSMLRQLGLVAGELPASLRADPAK